MYLPLLPALLPWLPLGLLLAGLCAPHTAAAQPAADAPIRVVSFNIRYNNPNDGENAWPNRLDRVAGLLRTHRADLVGVQEALQGMLDDLQERLPAFSWIGVGRADGATGGEYSALFYRTDRFALLDQGTFWLSETPEVPGSKSWDAAIERIVTWGQFEDRRTGDVFYYFNTHFDHRGAEARAESARLLRTRIAEIAGDAPVLLTGDFNADPASLPYQILTGAADDVPAPGLHLYDAMHRAAEPHYGPTSTWNGFTAIEPGRRIDFIFTGEEVRVLRHAILPDAWDGRFPSDHLPVLADVVLP